MAQVGINGGLTYHSGLDWTNKHGGRELQLQSDCNEQCCHHPDRRSDTVHILVTDVLAACWPLSFCPNFCQLFSNLPNWWNLAALRLEILQFHCCDSASFLIAHTFVRAMTWVWLCAANQRTEAPWQPQNSKDPLLTCTFWTGWLTCFRMRLAAWHL